MKLKNLLLIRNDRMGDFLMTLPAIHQIRQGFPSCRISLLIHRELIPLMAGHPDCDQLLEWNPEEPRGLGAARRWVIRFRKERFDAAVVFNPSKFFHGAVFLARIPVRIGYRRKWGFLLTGSIPDTKSERSLQEAEYNLELLPLLGLNPSSPILEWPAQPDAARRTEQFFQEEGAASSSPITALHPWTSNPDKSWSLEEFGGLARRLTEAGHPVVLLGGPREGSSRDRWRRQFPASVVDWVGRVPLDLLPAVLRRCSLLVSNDSGPVHVAAAVGTRSIVVAPRTHAQQLSRWKPLGSFHQILLSPSVEEVFEAALENLACAS